VAAEAAKLADGILPTNPVWQKMKPYENRAGKSPQQLSCDVRRQFEEIATGDGHTQRLRRLQPNQMPPRTNLP